jgi:hypothetical protein
MPGFQTISVSVTATVPLRGDSQVQQDDASHTRIGGGAAANADALANADANADALANSTSSGAENDTSCAETSGAGSDHDSIMNAFRNMSSEDRMNLARDLLATMSPDELRDLLQGMRRFPWEEDMGAQTDEIGMRSPPISPRSQSPLSEGMPSTPVVRERKLFAPAKKALAFFEKSRDNKNAKAKPCREARRTIAKIYEEKVKADEVDDTEGNRRAEMPTMVQDYFMTHFGVRLHVAHVADAACAEWHSAKCC